MDFQTGVFNLLGTLAMIPIAGFAAVWLVQRMVSGDLHVLAGFLGLFALVGLFAIAVFVPDNKMLVPVIVLLVSAMVYFPFAETQLEKQELIGIDTSRIDKAHRELSVRPDNVSARFDLARALYDRGLPGHAIALAENTLNGLSTTQDAMGNPSMRDKFQSEDYMIKQWRRTLTDPKAFEPVKCRACNTMNPPGTLQCERCKGPYLLELARMRDGSRGITTKVLVGFVLTMGMLVFCSWLALNTTGATKAVGMVAGLAVVGALLTWLYRPRTLRD